MAFSPLRSKKATGALSVKCPGFVAFGLGVRARLGSSFQAKHSRQSVIGFGGKLGVQVVGQSGVNFVHHLPIQCSVS